MPKRLLINSLPKSGTHLLAKVAELSNYSEHFNGQETNTASTPMFLNYRETKRGLSDMGQQESLCRDAILVGSQTPVAVAFDTFRRWLSALQSQQYILGHVAWSSTLSRILDELGYRHVFIIRDPRAVVISLLSFIQDTIGMPKPHFLQADFRLLKPSQQLDLLLHGGEAPLAQVLITPFSTVYQNMLNWRNDPRCLFLRFEDLVGPNGGGSEQKQHQAIKSIEKHLGHTLDSEQYKDIYSTTARTFRKGSIDGWKESLGADVIKRLNDYCKPLCKAAGYPHDC